MLYASHEDTFYFCDNRCSEKAVRCWQIASVVVEQGGEAHTIILCQQCCNERLVQQGKPRLKLWQWKGAVEKKAHRGRIWKVMGGEQFLRGMWEYITLKKAGPIKISADAARGKTRREARSVAAGVSLQRGPGTSQKKCGFRLRSPENAPCLPRNE